MCIITGKYKNQKIKTSEFIHSPGFVFRNALFNIIGSSVVNSAILDLFAGDGSFSIEALSRGAKSAIINDCFKKNLSIAKQNVEKICKDERILFMSEEEKFIRLPSFNKIDLIFCNSFNKNIGVTIDIINNIKKQKGSLKEIIFCAITNKEEMDLLHDSYSEFEPRRFGEFFMKVLSI
jgi:16S rRNA (guanine966-N2)-methyltransferase